MNLLFDEDSQKLIIMAKKEMFNLKHPYVGSEHLLLAILSYDKLEITKILNNYLTRSITKLNILKFNISLYLRFI